MAAPGTITHVIEVAAQLAVVVAGHADSLQHTAYTAPGEPPAAVEAATGA